MVFALIAAAGCIWAVAVVLEHLNRGDSQSVQEMLAQMDAMREADHRANVAALVAQMDIDFKENIERLRAEDMAAEERGYEAVTTVDTKTVTSEVTDALAGLGWARPDCRRLAEKAVASLGPNADIEDLVKYALTH